MLRFFVQPHQINEEDHKISIVGNDVNHIRNVLRMKEGDELWISDGQEKEYACTIEAFANEEVILHIRYVQHPDYELPSKIYLFQGLPKADKMELIIQKAVELGAYSVIPVSMKRCVVKLEGAKADKKTARWQQIAESAAKQSKRMLVPEVHSVIKFQDALEIAKGLDVCLVPYEMAKGMEKTKKIIEELAPGKSIGIFIGPEGGFEEEEIRMAMDAGAFPITLGHRILRTETAGLAILSVLMFHLEGE